jgi:hypothetical protein
MRGGALVEGAERLKMKNTYLPEAQPLFERSEGRNRQTGKRLKKDAASKALRHFWEKWRKDADEQEL